MENNIKPVKKQVRQIPLELVIISLLLLAAIFVFALIAHEAVFENEKVFDDRVFGFFERITTPGLIHAMEVVTFFGSSTFLLPAYIILIVYFLVQKRVAYAIQVGIIGASSTLIMFLLKLVFHRQRPQFPIIKGITTYSFPSGHALSAFIFCSLLVYIVFNTSLRPAVQWLLAVLLFFCAVAIAMSRIILKVHYPTDVIASFCLGTVWVTLSFWVLRKMHKASASKPSTQ